MHLRTSTYTHFYVHTNTCAEGCACQNATVRPRSSQCSPHPKQAPNYPQLRTAPHPALATIDLAIAALATAALATAAAAAAAAGSCPQTVGGCCWACNRAHQNHSCLGRSEGEAGVAESPGIQNPNLVSQCPQTWAFDEPVGSGT